MEPPVTRWHHITVFQREYNKLSVAFLEDLEHYRRLILLLRLRLLEQWQEVAMELLMKNSCPRTLTQCHWILYNHLQWTGSLQFPKKKRACHSPLAGTCSSAASQRRSRSSPSSNGYPRMLCGTSLPVQNSLYSLVSHCVTDSTIHILWAQSACATLLHVICLR